MRKLISVTVCLFFVSFSFGQLMVSKSIGKNSANSKLGFGTFLYYHMPINEEGNRSICLELLDLGIFPPKNEDSISTIGYISIKAGFKKIFSDTKTGFYVEPQAGYCRVVTYKASTSTDNTYGDGVALAFEAGYSLEVGQRGHTLNFGLKYENDIAGHDYNAQSIGLRLSYSFYLFQRRDS